MFKVLFEENIHAITSHTKEMIYFVLIYSFSAIPAGAHTSYLIQAKANILYIMLIHFLPIVPAVLFYEYCMSRFNFRPIFQSLQTFLLLTLAHVALLSFLYEHLSREVGYLACVLFIFLLFLFAYLLRNDRCNCELRKRQRLDLGGDKSAQNRD